MKKELTLNAKKRSAAEIAKITGLHPKYKFDRKFVRLSVEWKNYEGSISMGRYVSTVTIVPGVYWVREPSQSARYMSMDENGVETWDLTEEEVREAIAPKPIKTDASEDVSGLKPIFDKAAIMRRAWELYREENFATFGQALKVAWAEQKAAATGKPVENVYYYRVQTPWMEESDWADEWISIMPDGSRSSHYNYDY